MHRKITAFTLIEMLIVIVIIGILAAALIPRLQSIQSRARDVKRKTDLKQIYNANEIYQMDRWVYPHSGYWIFSSTPSTWMTWLIGTYLSSVPIDPINNGVSPFDTWYYAYRYLNVYGEWYYTMGAQLENKQDQDRCGVKSYYYWPWSLQTRYGPGNHDWLAQAYLYDPNNVKNGKH